MDSPEARPVTAGAAISVWKVRALDARVMAVFENI
jgi:hypothetical protein